MRHTSEGIMLPWYKYFTYRTIKLSIVVMTLCAGLIYYNIAPDIPTVRNANDNETVTRVNSNSTETKTNQPSNKKPELDKTIRALLEDYKIIQESYYYDNNTIQVHTNDTEPKEKQTRSYDTERSPVQMGNTTIRPVSQLNSYRKTDTSFYYFQGQWIQKPIFLSGKLPHFYLFSGIMRNSSSASWDNVRILGQWYNYSSYEKHVMCCFKYSDNTVIQNSYQNFKELRQCTIQPFYYVCPVPQLTIGKLPVHVGISFGNFTCFDNRIPYTQIVYPLREHSGALGICTKIAYGSLGSESLIEWLEAMTYLGVDKVITYADESLNKDALATLQYYERTGLVDFFPYFQPGKDIVDRNPAEKSVQAYRDGSFTSFDCAERLNGYTYISVLDFDEYLIPSGNRTLKQLMRDLLLRNALAGEEEAAAGFFFKTNFFIKSWGTENASSDLDLGKYIQRTEWAPKFDRRKAIVVNDRIDFYRGTHSVTVKPGYSMRNCPAKDAYMRHYRSCRTDWNKNDRCMDAFRRVTDREMINWASKTIASSVRRVRKEIFGN